MISGVPRVPPWSFPLPPFPRAPADPPGFPPSPPDVPGGSSRLHL